MANYDNTKFYWLQLKEDFFDDDAIQWIEEQPNGEKYAYFYLKMCVKSLKSDGILIRKVGELLIPYNAQKLAELTRTDIDTVRVAMELFKQIGLVEVLENGAIWLKNLEEMVGSQSKSAFKKQQQRQRQLQSGHLSTLCPPNCPPKIELDIDIDKEINKDNTPLQCNNKVTTSNTSKKDFSSEFEELWKLYPRKEGKQVALRVYNTCRKNNETTFEEVKQGILNYIKQIEKNKTQYQYIQHGSTWFNQKRWTDVYEIPTTKKIEEQEISEEKRNIMSLLAED